MDANIRKQKKESCNHELIKSEEFYVNELEAVITHIVQPLKKNADRCNVEKEDIEFVFGIMEHLLSFHVQLLRIIREEINIIPKFKQYFGFIQMYSDYMYKFTDILQHMSRWTQSIQFREFVTLRLQNENVREHIDERLCSLPWYLYRPFERIKQYYRFLKDLLVVTLNTDEEYKALFLMKCKLKPLYNKIKRRDIFFIKKTRLLEIQLQIFGNPELLVNDERYFVYTRMCQIKLSGIGKRLKHINLYIFNDMVLWVSKRGHWKKTIKFKDHIIYGKSTKNNKANDPLLFIGGGSGSGKSVKDTTHILMANEQTRDECLARIQKAHERYQRKIEQRLQVIKQPTLQPPELSATTSLTLDESFFDDGSQSLMPEAYQLKPLSSHHSIPIFNEGSSSGDMDDEHVSSTFYSKSSPFQSMSCSGSGSLELNINRNQNISYTQNNNNNSSNNYNTVGNGGSEFSIAISMVDSVQSMHTIPESGQDK